MFLFFFIHVNAKKGTDKLDQNAIIKRENCIFIILLLSLSNAFNIMNKHTELAARV